jgi:hypothetical protein
MPNFASDGRSLRVAWEPNPIDDLAQGVAATHNRQILFHQSQIALPPDWNAIILPVKVGIGPVGVRP